MFKGLGFLPGGNTNSVANGVSADGSTVVGESVVSQSCSGSSCVGIDEAFRWTARGGMTGLGVLPGDNSSNANAISGDGSTIVGYSQTLEETAPFNISASQPDVFRWTLGSGLIQLGPSPSQNGLSLDLANAISADGSTIVGFGSNNSVGTEAVRWTAGGGMVGLGLVPGTDASGARGVSSDGSTVVGYSQVVPSTGAVGFTGAQAFRWTAGGGMVGLGFLPGTTPSVANAVSTDGSTVVGFSGSQAFRWTASRGMAGLGFLPGGSSSFANGVSGNGLTVVGSTSLWLPNTQFAWKTLRFSATTHRPLAPCANEM